MAVSASDLTKLYLAYFGRPPDFDGMVYYTTQSNLTLQQIAANFSASPESQALYGSSSLSGVIDAIYMNLFNRHAEPGGLLYWSTEIASGRISPAFAAYAILIGAQNQDAVTVANKLQVATDFLAHLDTSAEITGYAGNDAAAVARAFLSTVDDTTASLTNAETNLDAAIAATISANDPSPIAVGISAPSIVEGNSGTRQLAFVVTLNHAAGSAITVSYNTTTTGTATAGLDFEATAGSLTFAPGETTKVVNVNVFGDGTVEADETVMLQVTGSTISNSGATGTGTITNDDSVPLLTSGVDTVDVSATAGPNTVKGVADPGGVPGASTFSNGDTINGNGLTNVQIIAASGGNAAFATINNVAEVDIIAGTSATISFNAVQWTGVGAIALDSGVSGATVQVKALNDAVDLRIGSNVGGSISASYTGGLNAHLFNSGKGGAMYDAQSGDVTVHLNTAGKVGGASFSSTGDITVGDVVIDGGANSATAFFGAAASGDLAVGGVSEAVGDSAAAVVSASATGDMTIASIAQNAGASGADIVNVTSPNGGDIVIGGIAQVAGTSGFAGISIDGSGDITLGDLLQQVGSGSSATGLISVQDAGGNISIANVTQGAGHMVSLSVSTTGTGTITVGDVVQGASTSDAMVSIQSELGSITVGDVSQTVGDSATASVSVDVRSSGTSATSVADITVGNITQLGGDGANVYVDLSGAGATNTTAATIGGALTVGNVSQTVGDSGYMSVSLTSTFGGVITVGDISQMGGDSASAWAFVSGSSDVTVGDVTISIGNATVTTTSQTAQFQAYGTGDVTVGNVNVSAGDGVNLNAWVTISNDTGHDLTIGDVTVGVGALGTSGTVLNQGSAFFGAFNQDASGDLTVGDVAMNLGLTATGAITISQSNATSLTDGGNVTVGDVTLTLADKAVVDNVWIHNNATVATSVSHTTLGNLGDLTVGNIAADMGTNAAVSVTVSETMAGTGGDVGTVHVGDIGIVADVNAYANVQVLAANYAGGDMAGVEIGDVSFNMDDGGSFTFDVTVSDTGGNLDHFTMGDVNVTLGVSGSVNEFSVDVRAGSIGDVSIGDLNVTLGENATATSMSITISASTGDIGTVTIGDIHTVVGQSASYSQNNIDIVAAGDIGSVNIGLVQVEVGVNASFTTNTITVSAAGDIGDVHVGGLQETLATNATGDGLYLYVYGNAVGTVELGDVAVNIGASASMSDLLYFSVTGTDIGSVVMGDETVNIAASGARTSYDTAYIQSNGGDIGSVTFGDTVYHLAAGAYTSDGINRTITSTGGNIGTVTVGDVGLYAATSASFTSGYHLTVNAGAGSVGDVTVGNVTAQGTSASDSITADFNITGIGVGDVTFGDLNATLAAAAATRAALVTVNVAAGTGDVGNVTFGDVTAKGSISSTGSVTVNVAGANIGNVSLGDLAVTANNGTAGTGAFAFIGANFTAASAIGDLNVGDVSVHLSGADATVSINVAAATASGDITVGNIDMALSLTTSSTLTGGAGHVVLNGDAYTGDVSIGTVSFDGTTAATLSVDLEVTGAGSVALGGIDVKGTGSFAGGDYVLTVNAGAADVMVDTIKMEDAGANNLTSVLAGITTTGTISLGTVDYSNHTGGAAIDVSTYGGDIHVIGSAGADTITSNVQSDTLTGGAGTDAFVITNQNQDLTDLTGFHAADVVTITDFKAGPTFAETIAVDAGNTTVAFYSEKTASSADAAFTLALATMTDPTQQSDVVAVQVGGDVYVFIDQDNGNDVDTIVKLSGVSNSALNFADFIVS